MERSPAMASHSLHPDSHAHGLADGCPRCDEHAKDPLAGLDNENIGVLAKRIALGWTPRSTNERKAMENLGLVRSQPDALPEIAFFDADLRRRELIDSIHALGYFTGLRLALISPELAVPELEVLLAEILSAEQTDASTRR